jgi:hypothetical protein
LGKGFPTGKIDENTTFDNSDFRNILARFTLAQKNREDLFSSITRRSLACASLRISVISSRKSVPRLARSMWP